MQDTYQVPWGHTADETPPLFGPSPQLLVFWVGVGSDCPPWVPFGVMKTFWNQKDTLVAPHCRSTKRR